MDIPLMISQLEELQKIYNTMENEKDSIGYNISFRGR